MNKLISNKYVLMMFVWSKHIYAQLGKLPCASTMLRLLNASKFI